MPILKTAAIATTTLVTAYVVGLFVGPSISTEIEIDAPASVIWKELTNGDAYPDWNPLVQRLSGDLVVGSFLNTTIQLGDNAPMDFTPEVLVVDENTEFRWVGQAGVPGIFDGEHFFILDETDEGITVFHHGENFTGLLAYPLFLFIGEDTKDGFQAMNQALKARAESKNQD